MNRGNRTFSIDSTYKVVWFHPANDSIHISEHGRPNRVQWSESMEMCGWLEIYNYPPRKSKRRIAENNAEITRRIVKFLHA